MLIDGTSGDDVLFDTDRRDKLTGDTGADVFTLGRDGKRDFVMDFEDGVDTVDFTDFNVTFEELFIYQIDIYKFVVEIRGEKTEVNFTPGGSLPTTALLTADDFVFDTGAAAPGVNLIADTTGADKLIGTGRPDDFLFVPDTQRDAVRRFELNKDHIDLSAYDTSFANLDMETIRPGRVIIHFADEHLVINDRSHLFTHLDFDANDFIFA